MRCDLRPKNLHRAIFDATHQKHGERHHEPARGNTRPRRVMTAAACAAILSATPCLTWLHSCKFGLFGKNLPTGAVMNVYLDNERQIGASENRMLTFSPGDQCASGFLKIEAVHLKGDAELPGYFAFSSKDVGFSIADEKSILIPMSAITSLGSHEILAESSLDGDFDMKFIINMTTPATNLSVEWNIGSVSDGIDYGGADSGKCDGSTVFREPVRLIAGATYTFTVSSPEGVALPDLYLETNAKDDGMVSVTRMNASNFRVRTSAYAKDREFTIRAGLVNSSILQDIPVLVTDISDATITERKKSEPETRRISLQKTDGARQYDISLRTTGDPGRRLVAYFAKANDDADISAGVTPGMRRSRLSDYANGFVSLVFDGEEHSLTLTPRSDTVEDGKNVFLFLYVWDEIGSYLGRWRISVGGLPEEINISADVLDTKTQSSGTISAEVIPTEKTQRLIWYLSPDRGHGSPPAPYSKSDGDSMMTFLNTLDSGSVTIDGTRYQASAHSFAITSDSEDNLVWTSGTQAGSCWLIAKCQDHDIWSSIPVIISGDESIVLKSTHALASKTVPMVKFEDSASFAASFTEKNLPDGQHYPDTAENNAYGSMTRSFYLPHDRESDISVSAYNTGGLSLTQDKDPTYAATLIQGQKSGEYTVRVNPEWHEANKNSKRMAGLPPPAQTQAAGTDAYGKTFWQYLGAGYSYLNTGKSVIRLRIVIYDAT